MLAKFALSCYKEIISCSAKDIEEIGMSILIPRFAQDIVAKLIEETKAVMEKDGPIIRTEGNIIVVGDIHGKFHDLVRIFATNGYPPLNKYLFLGDYVDRGEQSLDVILFLYILKLNFPEHIYLLRGNHEFRDVNKQYGFLANVFMIYEGKEVWEMFNDAFEYMPLCAFIGEEIFCVHGGISGRVRKSTLENLHFPIKDCSLVQDMVWSDPTEDATGKANSLRGKGIMFGIHVLLEFCKDMNVKMVIRAHECVNGFKFSLNKAVLTIFSSSNYGNTNNPSGFAYIDEEYNIVCTNLPPLPSIKATEISFHNVQYMQSRPQNLIRNCISSRLLNTPSRQGQRRLSNGSILRKLPPVANTTIESLRPRALHAHIPIPTPKTTSRSSRY